MVEHSGGNMGGQSKRKGMYFQNPQWSELIRNKSDISAVEHTEKGFFLLFLSFCDTPLKVLAWDEQYSNFPFTVVITVSHISAHTNGAQSFCYTNPSFYSLTTYSYAHTQTLPVWVPSSTAASRSQSSITSPEAGGSYSQQPLNTFNRQAHWPTSVSSEHSVTIWRPV